MKKSFFAGVLISLAAFAFADADILTAAPGEQVVTYGWADVGKMKYAAAKKITVIDDETYPDAKKKRQAFTRAIGSGGAAFIVLSGDVDLSDGVISDEDHSYFDAFSAGTHGRTHGDISFPVTSNKTIIGVHGARIMFGGLVIKASSNIIIRNVEFWDAHGSTEVDTKYNADSKASIDNLVITDGAKNIWIDHCTFSDGVCDDMVRNYNHDGLLDIPYGMNITVSYCEFKNHDKVMLVGSDEKSLSPNERSVTLHHNYFHASTQRMPRTRGTYMHIYNNVYDNIGLPKNPGYSLGPGTNAQFIVEHNYFGTHYRKVVDIYDKSSTDKAVTTRIYFEKNNITLDNTNTQTSNNKKWHPFTDHLVAELPWKIPYDYATALQTWEDAKETVLVNAGAGKVVHIAGYAD